ncbi:MAG: hypothetical protein AAFO83_13965 [Cyanobacteria bacterium J06607_13]
MSTKAEMTALEDQNPIPETTPMLTPGGALEEDVHQEVEAQRQRRIAFIQNRLASAAYRMRRDHMQTIRR